MESTSISSSNASTMSKEFVSNRVTAAQYRDSLTKLLQLSEQPLDALKTLSWKLQHDQPCYSQDSLHCINRITKNCFDLN